MTYCNHYDTDNFTTDLAHSGFPFNSMYKKYWTDYGIKEGNIIKSINGTKINTITDIEKILQSRNYNDPVSIEIINDDNITERFNFR